MLPGTTPSLPGDRGEADEELLAALRAGDVVGARLRLLRARVLVPVVALPAAGEAEMAVPALVDADGARALPLFTSYAALRAWRPDARPVPMSGARALAGARAEGYDAVVVDLADGHRHAVDGDDLAVLAAAAERVLADPSTAVVVVDEGPAGGAAGVV